MFRVMQFQRRHTVSQSWTDGTPKGGEFTVRDFRRGKRSGGRSRSQREYWPALLVQRCIGRKLLSVKRVKASVSENLNDSSILSSSFLRKTKEFLLERSCIVCARFDL